MLTDLFRRKAMDDLVADSEHSEHRLKKALGPVDVTALGIGAIIGAGIFATIGTAAAGDPTRPGAGPGLILSFVLTAVACGFAALCYAEFAAMVPISGSAYTYAYATLGELVAWIIGWDLILEYAMGAATVGVGWSATFVSLVNLLGIEIPAALTSPPFLFCSASQVAQGVAGCATAGWQTTGAVVNLPAVCIILAITTILVIGIRETAGFNSFIVLVKTGVLIVFVAAGLLYVQRANWRPFIPPNTGTFGEFGWSGVLRGAGLIFFAFIGFDAVSTAAQEAKRPQRDMPVGVLGSLAICTVLYIAVALVLTGIVKYTQLAVPDPIAVGVNAAGPGLAWLRPIVKIGAIAGLTSVILVMLLGQPRIFYTMSKDGLLPPVFAAVHPKFRTPWLASLVAGACAMAMAGMLPIGLLGELVSIGTLLAFAIVCGAVLVLRYTDPDIPRPFRTPWVPLVPLAGIAACFYLMRALPPDTWARLIIWMEIGLAIYFLYGRRHSKVGRITA